MMNLKQDTPRNFQSHYILNVISTWLMQFHEQEDGGMPDLSLEYVSIAGNWAKNLIDEAKKLQNSA